MSRISEMVKEEATAAETEPEPEPVEKPEPVEEPEPEPETSSNVSVDRAFEKIERENERHAKRIAEIMGDDFAATFPCPTCSGFAAGFTFDPPIDVPPMLQPDEFKACQRCNGYGASLTGSTVPGKESTTCRGCNGQGFIEVALSPAELPPAPPALIQTGNSNAADALRAAGYMVIDPPTTPYTP